MEAHLSSTPTQLGEVQNVLNTTIIPTNDGTATEVPIELKSPKKEDNSTPATIRKKPSRKSTVWDHFTKYEGENEPRCTCNYCDKDYACQSRLGTSSLWTHLNSQCKKYPFRVSDKKQKLLSFQSGSEGGPNLLAVAFNKENCRKALAKMVILDEHAFKFVEGDGFKQLMQVVQPRFILPSRITVARDIYKAYLEESVKLKEELRKGGQRVCLTTDCWTSIQQIPYLCLTAHYIDSEWSLQKRIINFCQIPNHKGETIGKTIESCLLGWGIEKVFAVTMDNAYANDVAINVIRRRVNAWKGSVLDGDFMHFRCCAHIVNLIVGDGLKNLHESIVAIRNVVRYIRSSPARLGKFKACVEKEKIDYKGSLVIDVPTRWNSTYMMLDVAIKFEKAFTRYEEEDDKYYSYFSETESGKKRVGPPTVTDWESARIFVKFLRTFYEVTLKFSGTLHVTSNTFFHEICEIHTQLTDFASSGDQLLSAMATSMKIKYDKYWGSAENINVMLFVAVVLDPRYKLRYLKYCCESIYGVETATKIIMKVKNTLNHLYTSYNVDKKDEGTSGSSSVASPPNTGIMETQSRKLLTLYLQQEEKRCLSENTNDIEKYLADHVVDPITSSFEILVWWKDNAMRYKVLSQIARDVLAVPVSTVASESAFSTGGRILDAFRSSLSPKMVEALVCTQNWLKASHEGLQAEEYLDDINAYDFLEEIDISKKENTTPKEKKGAEMVIVD